MIVMLLEMSFKNFLLVGRAVHESCPVPNLGKTYMCPTISETDLILIIERRLKHKILPRLPPQNDGTESSSSDRRQ